MIPKSHSKAEVDRALELAGVIVDEYKLKADQAAKIAKTAIKHEDPQFPRAEDILAVIGIESEFNPRARSSLRTDPAIGLMQVRPGVWGLTMGDLATPEKQIAHGARILKSYYDKLGSRDAAIHAYNVGITNYKSKKRLNPRYVEKFNAERELYNEL